VLGPQTTYGLAGLVPERTYYVAVTAYDRTGTESGLSEEITVTVSPQAPRVPTLMQEVLRRGQPTQFWVVGARPGEVVSFLFSAIGEGAGPCATEIGGLCVDISGPALFGEATADALGTATVSRTIPAEMLAGHTLAFQAVIRRGSTGKQSVKTNAITALIRD
jgi:fibronectin type 3 domain-containing protein